MKRKNILLSLFFLLIAFPLFSQFKIDGEFRPRAEYRDGYKLLGTEETSPAFFISQRSRLSFTYAHDWYETNISFQDIRVWGDEELYSSTGVYGDKASTDIHEAWLKLNTSENTYFKIGRQVFAYDDQRLLAGRNWNQNGLAYDALLFGYKNTNNEFNAAFSYNNMKENTSGNNFPDDKMVSLSFIRYQHQFNNLSASFLILGSGYKKSETSPTVYLRGTYGSYLLFNNEPWKLSASFYYQNGKNKYGHDVSAFFASARAGRAIAKWGVSLGMDYISGNAYDNDDDKDHLFDIMYGARHKYYGLMAHFSNIPTATAGAGLTDALVSVSWQMHEKHNIKMDAHYFMLSQNPYAPGEYTNGESLDKNLGTEVDIVYTAKLHKDVTLNAGLSTFIAEETMEVLQTGGQKAETAYWGWLMISIKPRLFYHQRN